MRIAYLINQYPKVSHSFIRREIQALERQGFDITRISIRGWDESLVDEVDVAERSKTRYLLQRNWLAIGTAVLITAASRPRLFARALLLAVRMGWRAERPLPYHLIYLAEACLVRHWLVEAGVSHIHAHFGTNSAEVAMLVRALGGPPFSFTVHGPEEFDKAPLIGLREKIRRAAFVVAVSSFGRSQLYRLVAHAYWEKIHVVHCGLEPVFFGGSPTYSDKLSLVCVGRLCDQKGQLLLIEAARRLAENGNNFTLTLAGDGELRGEIEALIAQNGLKTQVHITGWITSSEVRRHLIHARALVLPSFAEGLPVAVMEAMALRRPVISTYVAGIPELVRDGSHGWLIPSGDVDALVLAMHDCLSSNLEYLTYLGDAARERVIQRHHVDREAEKLAVLFTNRGSKHVE
jgi:colanic acid/amylovoran biosynthesis glycosyltransferase